MKEINNDSIHDELFQKQKPLLKYDESVDFESWKEQIREKYREALGLAEIEKNACEIKVDVEETYEGEYEGVPYVRYRYTFESERGCIVPCYLVVPYTGKAKYPVCICLQGHTTGFHTSIGVVKHEGRDEGSIATSAHCLTAIKNGYAALAIEQRGMGERTTPRADRGRALTCGCGFTAMTALLLGRTIVGERVFDVSKAIDSLAFFEGLDLNDITLLGNSGGGTATYYAAAYDERIKVAMPSCAVCAYKDSIAYRWHCTCNYIPGIAKYMDMGEIAALIAPRKLIVCAGELDPIFLLDGTKEVYSTIEKIYARAGAKDRCRLEIFEGKEHYFGKEQAFAALNEMRKR